MTAQPPSVRHDHVDQWRLAAARAAHPSSSAGAETILAAIAAGLAAVSPPWELTAGRAERSAELDHEPLLATEAYDAWLVHWPPGASLEAHDHGPSAGAFAVVSGVLEEATLRSGVLVSTRLQSGDTVHFEAGHRHRVTNRSPDATTSVHVYAPPLRAPGRGSSNPT